ncbi:hypothetical protein BD413DRAFT_500859 [Trametes elegans]|nr:hypothetical protein BD413DRAFT_500859 [Trametes elegans]
MAGVRTGGKRTFSEYAGRVELPPPAMNWDDPPEEGPLRWRDGRAEKRPRPPPGPIDLTGEDTGTAEAPIDLTSERGASSSVGPIDLTSEHDASSDGPSYRTEEN